MYILHWYKKERYHMDKNQKITTRRKSSETNRKNTPKQTYTIEESVRSLYAAITIQALKDIETKKRRCENWRSVWTSLKTIAPAYKLTRGELVIRAAMTGAVKMTYEEMLSRHVAETAHEKKLLRRYLEHEN